MGYHAEIVKTCYNYMYVCMYIYICMYVCFSLASQSRICILKIAASKLRRHLVPFRSFTVLPYLHMGVSWVYPNMDGLEWKIS